MTIEQLEQGKELLESMESLESTIKDLNNTAYKKFKISGITAMRLCAVNDNTYPVTIIPDELMDDIRKYYLDKYAELKSEFEKL